MKGEGRSDSDLHDFHFRAPRLKHEKSPALVPAVALHSGLCADAIDHLLPVVAKPPLKWKNETAFPPARNPLRNFRDRLQKSPFTRPNRSSLNTAVTNNGKSRKASYQGQRPCLLRRCRVIRLVRIYRVVSRKLTAVRGVKHCISGSSRSVIALALKGLLRYPGASWSASDSVKTPR